MKQELYMKEGNLSTSVMAVPALVVGLGVGVLILVFVGTLGGSTYNLVESDIDAIGNHPITMESFTASNVSKQQLAHNFIQEGTLAIYNGSTAQPMLLNNFTIDYDDGSILLKPVATVLQGWNSSTMYANYTWGADEVRTSAQQGIASGFEALQTTGNYLPVIVLAVVIAMVLGLVIGFTAIGMGGGGKGSAL